MRHKLKGAVYAVSLMESLALNREEGRRQVGKKYRHATSGSQEMAKTKYRRASNLVASKEELVEFMERKYCVLYRGRRRDMRRRLRAAVYAVLAALELQEKGYHEPIFEWEDTTVPTVRPWLAREVSFGVEDMFASEEDYQSKLRSLQSEPYKDPVFEWEDTTVPTSRPKFVREVSLDVEDMFASEETYQRKLTLLRKEEAKKKFEAAVLAVMGAHELNRAWDMNMHPRNKFRGIETAVHAMEQQKGMVEVSKLRLHSVVMAVVQAQALSRALNMNMHPRNKFGGIEYAVSVQPYVSTVIKAQEIYRHLYLNRQMRHKLRGAILAIEAVQYIEAHLRAKMEATAVSKEYSVLMKCHNDAVREQKVKSRLVWLGSNNAAFHRHFHHRKVDTENKPEMKDINAPPSPNSGIKKLNFAINNILHTSE